jgi:hypothetical protein
VSLNTNFSQYNIGEIAVKTFSTVISIIVVTGAIFSAYTFLTTNDQLLLSEPDISVLNDHDGISIRDLVNRESRFSNLNQMPMFKVEAISFAAVDESGVDWLGSDEVVAVWRAANSPGANTREFSSVDSGDIKEFHPLQSCIFPINYDGIFINGNAPHNGQTTGLAGWECVTGGGIGPIIFEFSLYEMDDEWHSFFNPCFNGSVGTDVNTCIDDFLGGATIRFTVDELIEMLPNVGSSKDFNHISLTTCGENTVCSVPWLGPDYRFSYRITRMDNIEVPQVLTIE